MNALEKLIAFVQQYPNAAIQICIFSGVLASIMIAAWLVAELDNGDYGQ